MPQRARNTWALAPEGRFSIGSEDLCNQSQPVLSRVRLSPVRIVLRGAQPKRRDGSGFPPPVQPAAARRRPARRRGQRLLLGSGLRRSAFRRSSSASRAFALTPACGSQAMLLEDYYEPEPKLITTVTAIDCPAVIGTAAGSPLRPSRILLVSGKLT